MNAHRIRKALSRYATIALSALTLAVPVTAQAAPAPTPIGNFSNFNGLIRPNTGPVTSYCYNFNNYIQPTDSPVIGGIVIGESIENRSWKVYLVRGFGKACVTKSLTFASPANPAWFTAGWLIGHSASTGDWYSGGFTESCGESCSRIPPLMSGSCPANTAPIQVYGYVLPDGGTLVPNINSYLFRYVTPTWDNPLAYPNSYQITSVMLCVKTDTTQ